MQVPLGAPQPKSGRFRRSASPKDSGVAGVPAESGSPGATGQAGPADSLGSSRAPDGSGAPARAGGPGNRQPPPSSPPPQMGGHGGSSSNGQLGSPLGSGDAGQSRWLVRLCIGALVLALLLAIGGMLAPRLLDAIDGGNDEGGASAQVTLANTSHPTATTTASAPPASAQPRTVLTALTSDQPTSQPSHAGGPSGGALSLDGGTIVAVDRHDRLPLRTFGASADAA